MAELKLQFSRRAWLLGLAAGFAAGAGTMATSQDALAAWKPKKPVEFVIMAGKGGGADRLARFIQGIIEKNKLSPKPFVPINKGGGSGAEALRYVKDKAGDPHVIMATLNSYYTTPLRNPGIGVDISKFTPIARLAEAEGVDLIVLGTHGRTGLTRLLMGSVAEAIVRRPTTSTGSVSMPWPGIAFSSR